MTEFCQEEKTIDSMESRRKQCQFAHTENACAFYLTIVNWVKVIWL